MLSILLLLILITTKEHKEIRRGPCAPFLARWRTIFGALCTIFGALV
jgi:hypothetical protein